MLSELVEYLTSIETSATCEGGKTEANARHCSASMKQGLKAVAWTLNVQDLRPNFNMDDHMSVPYLFWVSVASHTNCAGLSACLLSV